MNMVVLKVSNRRIKAEANGNPVNKGNLRVGPGSLIKWKGTGSASDADYLVTFQNLHATDPQALGWPFKDPTEPADGILRVPSGGQALDTTLEDRDDCDWSYTVQRGNAQALDPMIIVREVSLGLPIEGWRRPGRLAAGAVVFLAGTVIGMLLSRR